MTDKKTDKKPGKGKLAPIPKGAKVAGLPPSYYRGKSRAVKVEKDKEGNIIPG